MRVYFIRHGKTEYNQTGRFQGGAVDSPLLEASKQKAIEVGAKLEGINFSGLYSSPLERALSTAQYLQKGHAQLAELDLVKVPDFREIEFGDWEGKYVTEKQEHPQFINLRKYPEKYDPTAFSGEKYEDLLLRSKKALKDILIKHDENDNILIISHGVTLTTLLKDLTGASIEKYREEGLLENTSISGIETHDKGETIHLIMWNKKITKKCYKRVDKLSKPW